MKIKIQESFLLFLGILILILDLKLVLMMLLSCLLHELGHIVTMVLFGAKINYIKLSSKGFEICCKDVLKLGKLKQIIIYLNGPLMNLIVYKICQNVAISGYRSYLFFTFSAINFFLMIFNLLPLNILDGGQILYIILSFFIKDLDKLHFLTSIISKFVNLVLLILGIIYAHKTNNFSLLLLSIFLFKK